MDKKGTILIVDDIETNRVILNEVLIEEYDVLECDNGFDAIILAQKHSNKIVMVLLDIHMPEMDGYEVLQTLKNMHTVAHIPVIFISASGLDENEEKGLLAGAVDYINKPFNPFVVLCRINNQYELSKYRLQLEQTISHQTTRLLNVRDTILDTITTMVEHR
ncbi:MAG: response regulator, partial [Oscillospiraceae bacterium]